MRLKTIKLNVNRLMAARNMTQTDLQHDLRVSYATAHKLTTGRMTAITFEVLARLCEVFDVTPGDILALQDSPPKGRKTK